MKKVYTKIILASFFAILIVAFVVGNDLQSRPQYSVLKTMGTKCTSCHVNANYGGQRNFGGWLGSTSVTIWEPDELGLGGLYGAMTETNSAWEDKIMFGMDFRLQNALWAQTSKLTHTPGNPKPTLERNTMAMQLMPYLKVQPLDWMSVDAGYNIAYDIHNDMRYPGQQPGYFSAKFSIDESLPSLRVGFFAPPIGVDYDDHTVLVRQVAGVSRSQPLIPADYAEFGANLNYDGISWMNASLGMFSANKMSVLQASSGVPVVDKNTMSTVANVSFHPTLPYGLNTFFGVSHYLNGSLKTDDGVYIANEFFYITSIYFNIGLSDRVALLTEYITSEKQAVRSVDNYLIELDYQLMEGLYLFGRYESATTKFDALGEEYNGKQYVFGAHIFPLPYIDILPEYRMYDRGDVEGYSAQWAVQLHIFY